MRRSEKILGIPLPIAPLASFVICALLEWILRCLPAKEMAFAFAFLCCMPFCGLCSIVSGLYAVKRKRKHFQKCYLFSIVLLFLAILSVPASGLLYYFFGAGMLMADIMIFGLVCAILYILTPICFTIFVMQDVSDIDSWLLFVTQISWAYYFFYFFYSSLHK